jgi:catechol 2,3-dioxygenase-like lactoylglutathione lyase family enzyme
MAIMRYLVKDTEEAIAFYTQRLGFSLVNNFGPFAIVSKADLTLWLAAPPSQGAGTGS